MRILVLNAGSSGQKCRLYEVGGPPPDDPLVPVWESRIEWDAEVAIVETRTAGAALRSERVAGVSRRGALERILESLWRGKGPPLATRTGIDIVGHRVVHGGADFDAPVLVTAEVKGAIARLSAFAPLHNQAALEGIETVEHLWGGVPQVAVFDTAFHRHLPRAAAVFPGPYEWLGRGIRRYGFHGINHQYCAERAARLFHKERGGLRLVTCHLGSGCSLAAIRDGQSVDTTMGFTPLDGLMMGTRSGALDPGVLTYLLAQGLATAAELEEVLNTKSGLLGISGLSGDMRQILVARRRGHERATLAFDMYVHRLRSYLGAMVGVLGGVDGVVFTAGVGENSPEVRAAACTGLAFLGLELDPARNADPPADGDIGRRDAAVRALIVRAGEEWAIARACWTLAPRPPA